MSPPLVVNADENPLVCIWMAASAGSTGRIVCVSDGHFGMDNVSFPIRADGKMHSYNVDMSALEKWSGTVLMIGLQPTDAPGRRVEIESIAKDQMVRIVFPLGSTNDAEVLSGDEAKKGLVPRLVVTVPGTEELLVRLLTGRLFRQSPNEVYPVTAGWIVERP